MGRGRNRRIRGTAVGVATRKRLRLEVPGGIAGLVSRYTCSGWKDKVDSKQDELYELLQGLGLEARPTNKNTDFDSYYTYTETFATEDGRDMVRVTKTTYRNGRAKLKTARAR